MYGLIFTETAYLSLGGLDADVWPADIPLTGHTK